MILRRSAKTLATLRREQAAVWVAAATLWLGLLLWTQRPWQSWDSFQLTQWTAIGMFGMLIGGLQQRGRDYWPANLVFGLGAGAPSVMYVSFAQLTFHGDVPAFTAWARASHLGVWAWGCSGLLMAWALYLVWRVNHGQAGSAASLTGHLDRPTPEMIDGALAIIERADRHRLYNKAQRQTRTRLIQELADAALNESARARAYNEHMARERARRRAGGGE
jgi:hypothetical protein